jgi:predicted dehydrogenase
MPRKTSRRRFLKSTAGIGALTAVSSPAWCRPIGANGDVRIAVVGLNAHGTDAHLRNYLKIPGVRVVALCDPDRRVLARAGRVAEEGGARPRSFTDIRKLLDEPEVDAISGATPNHWHALSTIWACQAGKHVCVEKPVSHNIWEGRKMVEAARKYQRLVQADLDLRSCDGRAEAIDFLRRGGLGRILIAHAWVYKRRQSIGKVRGAGIVPEEIDYDLWCGPAPKGPLPRKNLHYDWHWQWDTGNGETGNNGPHYLDACRWALGEPGLPATAFSTGGRYGYDDDGETPNTQIVLYEYPTAPILFEVRGLPCSASIQTMDDFRARSLGNVIIQRKHTKPGPHNGAVIVCEGGTLDLNRLEARDRDGRLIKSYPRTTGNRSAANFIRALHSGKEADLRIPIEEGHLSTAICHMGNISHRIGQQAKAEEARERIAANPQVADAFDRMKEHLAANGVRLGKEGAVLGPKVTMDSAAERFVGDFAEEANGLLARSYREPFVVPEEV